MMDDIQAPALRPLVLTTLEVRSLLETGTVAVRRPVSPANSEPLGHRVTGKSLMWTGLDFSRATVREQSSLFVTLVGTSAAPPDYHLSVPWNHPEDPPGNESQSRVRPRWEVGDRAWAREAWAGQRHSRVEYKADDPGARSRWQHAAQMPRWAARLVVEVEGVEAERDEGAATGWAWVWEVRRVEGEAC